MKAACARLNPLRQAAKPTKRTPQPMNRKQENRRIKEGQDLVSQSISLHGGPYRGCDECGDLEDQKLAALPASEDQWTSLLERWQHHLIFD